MPEQSALDRAMDLFRRGDPAEARREAEAALAATPGDERLLHFLGTLSCRTGALDEGVRWFERALAANPADAGSRLNLVKALIALGRVDEALQASESPSGGDHVELGRLRGHLLQHAGRNDEAAAAYDRVLSRSPGDWEIWNNLGNTRRALGDLDGAIAALERAAALRADVPPILMNLASALIESGRPEEALVACRCALAASPGEPAVALETGRLLRHLGRFEEAVETLRPLTGSPEAELEQARALTALHRLDEAEQAYRSALRARPDAADAWLELGIVLERAGRGGELLALLDQAGHAGIAEESLGYLRALLMEREGRTAEALAWVRRAPLGAEAVRTLRLTARLADRTEDAAAAFEAASQANRLEADQNPAMAQRAAGYRGRVDRFAGIVTPQYYGRWAPPPATLAGRAPIFLVGFPRSGTTLLDTMLMGHPRLHVLEEVPLLDRVMAEVGELERLAELDADEVARLRALYFSALDEIAPAPEDATIVDKLPLNILAAPLIHRLFPDARFLLALRHPCDVALSCFMQGFELNDAMANFLDLGDTAALYDRVMGFWQSCRQIFPLRICELRYEALVADPEGALRSLLACLDLDWDARVLDHRRTAAGRGVVSTPSYNQVTRRVYGEASGRWQRYREQLAPVLPVLLPWAERLGYEA